MTKRIKVAQIITGLLPGGAERLLLDICQHLRAESVEVVLISLRNRLSALDVYGYDGEHVHVFDMSYPHTVQSILALRRFLNVESPDIIHAHMYHGLLAAVLSSIAGRNRPICFTSHRGKYSPIRSCVVRTLRPLRAADIILSAGQHPEMNVTDTRIVPNGVSVSATPFPRVRWPKDGRVRFLMVGRLVDEKDPLGLLDAFARLRSPLHTLEFVGAGPLERSIRQRIAALRLQDQVTLVGLVSNVRERMRESDVLLIHSRQEGMPMSLLEAGAEAMPVIATPVGSIPSILEGSKGWIATAASFTSAMAQVIDNPSQAIEAGRRLHAHVLANHSIERVARMHKELYSSLVTSRYES